MRHHLRNICRMTQDTHCGASATGISPHVLQLYVQASHNSSFCFLFLFYQNACLGLVCMLLLHLWGSQLEKLLVRRSEKRLEKSLEKPLRKLSVPTLEKLSVHQLEKRLVRRLEKRLEKPLEKPLENLSVSQLEKRLVRRLEKRLEKPLEKP